MKLPPLCLHSYYKLSYELPSISGTLNNGELFLENNFLSNGGSPSLVLILPLEILYGGRPLLILSSTCPFKGLWKLQGFWQHPSSVSCGLMCSNDHITCLSKHCRNFNHINQEDWWLVQKLHYLFKQLFAHQSIIVSSFSCFFLVSLSSTYLARPSSPAFGCGTWFKSQDLVIWVDFMFDPHLCLYITLCLARDSILDFNLHDINPLYLL